MKNNNTKIFATVLGGISLSFLLTQSVFAEETNLHITPSTTVHPTTVGQPVFPSDEASELKTKMTVSVTPSTTDKDSSTDIGKWKSRADKEITRRITDMNKLITVINGSAKLTAAEKTSLVTQINAQITSLTTLKTKIDADTDLTTLKTDIQSIITEYRIFSFFMPLTELLAASDRLENAIVNLQALEQKLSTRLTALSTSGQNVTTLQQALTDMQTKLADAQTQYTAIENELIPLTPAGYPANKTTLEAAHKALATVRTTDIEPASKDAKTIISGIKGLKPSPTPSVSVSVTPSI